MPRLLLIGVLELLEGFVMVWCVVHKAIGGIYDAFRSAVASLVVDIALVPCAARCVWECVVIIVKDASADAFSRTYFVEVAFL